MADPLDPARIAAQVVSGISFLGAGVIFKNGNSIRGLTTAAGMWGTAAIGMAVGAGMYWLGLFESAVLVAIQVILHRFPVGADALTTQEILVEMEDTEDMQRRFDELQRKGVASTWEQVLEEQRQRDLRDSTRADSPLQPANDAVILDTSGLDLAAVVALVLALVPPRR